MLRAQRWAAHVIACARCGFQAPDDFAYCPKCATPLVSRPAVHEERKVVTTLFCDLVAFTAMSEAADPEDVDRLLGEYFARAAKVIESHGGTVEKFIGDAVVGVFGVPVVHEDDPERAVRAAMRILEALGGMIRPDGTPLQARCGVNTGEALVRLDVDPASGRGFLTGDAVNVAARLEAAAPPMGVAVGALTHELTVRVIEYQELPAVIAKGKAESVATWLAERPRSRTGLRTAGDVIVPFLGRGDELGFLQATFEAVCASQAPRFAFIVGEPGIGKSRLVLEFAHTLDERPEMVTWRQGRCPPYGESVAFAALAEIVKGEAGILDSDDVTTVEEKLESVVIESEDRSWLRQRLRPLLGLSAVEASREENFTAWTLFLAQIASSDPAVLVLEDLHWADDGMLAFVRHLAAQDLRVPLFVLATARPELEQRRPGALCSPSNATRITLAPLASRDTDSLVSALLDAPLAEDVRALILAHVGGNPLYAEEYVRLLLDRRLLRGREALHLREGTKLPLPNTVQAVLAARLDALPPKHKAILCSASVFGESFWRGGVAALAQLDPGEVASIISALAERQLVRPAAASSLEGEVEYLFWHATVRDVGYGELPRAVRAKMHGAAGDWLAGQVAGHEEDLAEVLAHHYATALELARSSGDERFADRLLDPASRYLSLAGDRTLNIDAASAERHYARALDFVRTPGAPRDSLVINWGEALYYLGSYQRSADVIGEAARSLEEAGETRAAARAMSLQARALYYLGDPSALDLSAKALSLLETDGPSCELVHVLESLASYSVVLGDSRVGIELAERALTVAEELGAPEPVEALHFRGLARCDLGDAMGLRDVRRALALASDREPVAAIALLQFNLGAELWLFEGSAAALKTQREALDLLERVGRTSTMCQFATGIADSLIWAGDWDGALTLSLATDSELEVLGDVLDLAWLRANRSLLLALRGEAAAAQALIAWATYQTRTSGDPAGRRCCAIAAAQVCALLGDPDGSLAALSKYRGLASGRIDVDYALRLPLSVRVALLAHDMPLARGLAAAVTPSLPLYQHSLTAAQALLDEAGGKAAEAALGFAEAAGRWHEFGVPYEEAQALFGKGRCLVALDRAREAAPSLEDARGIFERLGAKPAFAEVDRLLSGVTPAPGW